VPDGERAVAPELCSLDFSLCRLKVGEADKLGNPVKEILWQGRNYAIYRSTQGVFIHFSDDPKEELAQRTQFTEICPELCELRYLNSQMEAEPPASHGFRLLRGWSRASRGYSANRALYDHNIAQALMLTMEGKGEMGKSIAGLALSMAVRRVTADNTIRYVRAAVLVSLLWVVFCAIAAEASSSQPLHYCLLASAFGAVGAVLSIITRVEAFELKPCEESHMNYWLSGIRVGMGMISGVVILLLTSTFLGDSVSKLVGEVDLTKPNIAWQAVALLGIIGGFAERLIPILLKQSADKMETKYGTPVEAARGAEKDAVTSKPAANNNVGLVVQTADKTAAA
jgi:hypothetical protein